MRKIIFIVILPALLVCACSGKTELSGAAELRYGFTTEPATLDPLNPANTADGRSILFNVFEGLVKPDAEGALLPCIAESWTIEQNGFIYDFKLREGIRFHDGSLLTSADVKFSLETAAAAGFTGIRNITLIETQGENRIRLTLESPDPEFLSYATTGIVKAGNIDREKNIAGTGPFFIESYQVQQSLVLRKFDRYWQKLPREKNNTGLEKVTIVFLPDSDSLIPGLKGGGIDGASITGALASQLDPDRFDIVFNRSASVQLLALNNAVKPLDDILVRCAINYAIDIDEIIDAAFFGMGEPSCSPLIPGLSAYYQPDLDYPVDPDLAQALLAEAGYGEGGQKLSLEITVPSNYTMHVDTAQVIVGQLTKIGVDASIKLVDWATWLSDVYRHRQYQATIISLDGENVSPRSFLSRYHSSAGDNFINFANADFDRVYEAALSEIDNEKRAQLYREAQRIIAASAASVYIQDIFYLKAFRTGTYGGVLDYPLYVIDFASMYRIGK